MTKLWAVARFTNETGAPNHEYIDVIGSLVRFGLVFNKGAAFSSRPQDLAPFLPPWLFFLLISIVASVVLLWFYRSIDKRDWKSTDSFEFTLAAEEGYGEYHPEYVVTIPKEAFAIDGKVREDLLVIGRMIPMMNQDGQVVQGTVANVLDDSVAMDFNHPMAGKTLHFTGKVEAVRDATDKELKEGLHGEYLPPEEGCCKKGKGGGCCHGEGHGDGEGCCHGEGHGHGEG